MHRVWLSGGLDAPAGARAAIDLLTVDHFDERACEELRLLVSELVTNSVRHGGAGGRDASIELTVVLSQSRLRLECADPLGGFDVLAPPPGHGLMLVEELSTAWGTRYGADGSTWFEFDRNGGGAAPA